MLGRMSAQAVHGDSSPEEVSAAIGRATEAAVRGGHAAIVETLLAFLKACGWFSWKGGSRATGSGEGGMKCPRRVADRAEAQA